MGMGCLFCSFVDEKKSPKTKKVNNINKDQDQSHQSIDKSKMAPPGEIKKDTARESDETSVANDCDEPSEAENNQESDKSKARTFTFAQMVAATQNFNAAYFLGEGGFGKVYKGILEDSDQVVAIKQLDPDGGQGMREFVVEVLTLSMADHPNLVKLIGYCAEAEQRLLVYEYMPLGSLEDHLQGLHPNRKRLDWNARMKIAAGAARGLAYLHDQLNPHVIYRDLKCSNILLEEDYHAKLSDFGLAKVGPIGDNTHVSTRVMGTYGYCAPDYAMNGQLTFKSDIYSFGVVLLELITWRRAIDNTKAAAEQNLDNWYSPMSEDLDECRYYESNACSPSPSQTDSRPTSPVSPYRFQRHASTFSPGPPYPGAPAVTPAQARQRGSDTEGRFPSSPSHICHSADLRRAALLRTQPMGSSQFDAPFSPMQEAVQPCPYSKSLDQEIDNECPDHEKSCQVLSMNMKGEDETTD